MKRNNILTVILVILVGIFAYMIVSNLRQETQETVTAVQRVRDFIVPATPVILPDSVTIVREVRQVARLETATFTGEKIITAEQDSDFLFGLFEETIIFVAVGEVIAGIDLEKMSEDDIQVIDPVTVMVHLPEAEVLVTRLDNEQSSVLDRDQGLLVGFSGTDPQLESEVRKTGEQVILEEALEFGILEEADQNAQEYMEGFLQGLGFEVVIFTEETPPTPEPYEQPIPKGYELEEN